MTNEVIDNLEFDEESGALSYKGIRYFLIRPETLGDLHALVLEALGDRGDEAFYQAGYSGVSRSLRAYEGDLGLKGEAFLAYLVGMGTQLGWGKMRLLSLDPARNSMLVEVKNSVFVRPTTGRQPQCHMLRGVLAAIGEAVFGTPAVARELACAGMGDTSCRFVVTTNPSSGHDDDGIFWP